MLSVAGRVGAGNIAGTQFLQYPDYLVGLFPLAAGATQERAVETQFWGDRMGTLVDPFGHRWSIATQVEVVAPEEIQKRMAEWSKGQAAA